MPITAAPPDPIAAALWFLEQGFSVFPCFYPKTSIVCSCGLGARCPQPGKHPATVGGFKDATTDREMVKTFLKNPGTRNYGLVCPEGVIAVDVDGDEGKAAWDDLQKTLGPLPATLTTRTANGFHFFFKVPPSVPGGKMFGFVVRDSHSGYVIGPGSKHASGVYYKANRGADGQPLPIQPLPEAWVMGWLLDRAEPGVGGPLITVHGDSATYAAPASVAEGGRYDEIVRYTAHLHNTGISREEQFALVESVLNPRFHPPLAPDELRSRFDRATRGMEARLGPPISPRARDDDAPIVVAEAASTDSILGASAYIAAVPDHVDWFGPFAYASGVSMVAGPPKAGKSTLVSQLLRCRDTGEPMFGTPVPQGRSLLVTEEGGVPVVRKVEGITNLDILDRRAAVLNDVLKWGQILGVIKAWGERSPDNRLVIIDTLAVWANVRDENDATQMTRALDAVNHLAATTGLAIVVIHHTRKGGGEGGEDIRGSSAIAGTVAHFASLAYGKKGPRSDDRLLSMQGRMIFSTQIGLEFDRSTMAYAPITVDYTAVDDLLKGVPVKGSGEPGITAIDLANLWGPGTPAATTIRRLVDEKRLYGLRSATERGKPWRYWAVPLASITFGSPIPDDEPRDARSVGERMATLFGDPGRDDD